MPKKQKLPLPQGYTRKFEIEDFLVQRLVARGLNVTSEDGLRKILRAEVCMRFISNYFNDGYGHLGDIDTRSKATK